MKTLLFFRHGKSDWDAEHAHDHERPINRRGRKAARRMGRFLAETDQVPDRVLTSSAVRARQTLDEALAKGGWKDVPVDVTDALYEASPDGVLAAIRQLPEAARRALLVGHEPTWSETVARLVGGGSLRFPTAALARVDVAVERWQDVAFGAGELIWFVPPKLLDASLK